MQNIEQAWYLWQDTKKEVIVPTHKKKSLVAHLEFAKDHLDTSESLLHQTFPEKLS